MVSEWTYTLTPEEWAEVKALADARFATNRKNGVRSMLRDRRGPIVNEREGMIGELAFARLAGWEADLGDDAPRVEDFTHGTSGATIDVKATRYKTGKLIAHPHKAGAKACDWYALMIVAMPEECEDWMPYARFAGASHYLGLLNDDQLMELRPGSKPCYALEQADLLTPAEFFDLVAKPG